jgi:hypothetical protein
MERYDIVNDIINSIKFYIMLDIVKFNYDHASKSSLQEYRKELKKVSLLSEERINHYIQVAHDNLPSEFRSIFKIPSNSQR